MLWEFKLHRVGEDSRGESLFVLGNKLRSEDVAGRVSQVIRVKLRCHGLLAKTSIMGPYYNSPVDLAVAS